MLNFSSTYVVYVDGYRFSTKDIASTTWVIFSPIDEQVISGAIYLGPTTNNIMEYIVVIELLFEYLDLGIHQLVVRLDFQLMLL